MTVSSYHYLQGPLIAMAALGVILLICRWVFSTDHRSGPSGPPVQGPTDYGLLQPVAVVRTRDDADMLRGVLRDAGIRGSVTASDGAFTVLVFPADAAAARDVVRS